MKKISTRFQEELKDVETENRDLEKLNTAIMKMTQVYVDKQLYICHQMSYFQGNG